MVDRQPSSMVDHSSTERIDVPTLDRKARYNTDTLIDDSNEKRRPIPETVSVGDAGPADHEDSSKGSMSSHRREVRDDLNVEKNLHRQASSASAKVISEQELGSLIESLIAQRAQNRSSRLSRSNSGRDSRSCGSSRSISDISEDDKSLGSAMSGQYEFRRVNNSLLMIVKKPSCAKHDKEPTQSYAKGNGSNRPLTPHVYESERRQSLNRKCEDSLRSSVEKSRRNSLTSRPPLSPALPPLSQKHLENDTVETCGGKCMTNVNDREIIASISKETEATNRTAETTKDDSIYWEQDGFIREAVLRKKASHDYNSTSTLDKERAHSRRQHFVQKMSNTRERSNRHASIRSLGVDRTSSTSYSFSEFGRRAGDPKRKFYGEIDVESIRNSRRSNFDRDLDDISDDDCDVITIVSDISDLTMESRRLLQEQFTNSTPVTSWPDAIMLRQRKKGFFSNWFTR